VSGGAAGAAAAGPVISRPGRRSGTAHAAGRLLAGLLVATVSALTLLMWLAGPASAHASLLATTPAAGYSVTTSPAALTLVFDQPVSVQGVPLRLSGPAGPVPLGAARLSNGSRWLTAPVTRTLPTGRYTVAWQVVAADGDTVGGGYCFGVGAVSVAAVNGPGTPATRGLVWAALLRWVLFAALSVALGGLVGQALARRVVRRAKTAGRELARVRAPVAAASAVGGVAAAGLAAHLLGSGNVISGLGKLSLPALLGSGTGRLSVIEAAAFLLAAALAVRPRLQVLAVAPLLAVVIAEGRRSHVRELAGDWGWLLLAVHLTAAGIWVGALVHVVRVAWAWRARPVAAHRVISEYARLALLLVLLVIATGAVAAIVVLPNLSALTTTGYGRFLLAKIALVASALALAIASRWWLRNTSPLRPEPRTDVVAPGRAARIERAVLVAVLAVTALLVSVATPRSANSVLALPPPPTGPIVRLATLIGQVTVDVAASDGQLEVRTSVPNPGAEKDSEGGQATNIAAEIGPTGHARPVALRRCGPDCFVGPAQWSHGDNQLSVSASATGWAGGTATFTGVLAAGQRRSGAGAGAGRDARGAGGAGARDGHQQHRRTRPARDHEHPHRTGVSHRGALQQHRRRPTGDRAGPYCRHHGDRGRDGRAGLLLPDQDRRRPSHQGRGHHRPGTSADPHIRLPLT
jgi:copper transport protein